VLLAGPLGGADDVGERGLGLLPAAGLEAAVRVDEEQVGRDLLEHLGDALLDLVLRGHARRVDVVDARLRKVSATNLTARRTPIWLLYDDLVKTLSSLRSEREASMEMTSASRRAMWLKMSLKSE